MFFFFKKIEKNKCYFNNLNYFNIIFLIKLVILLPTPQLIKKKKKYKKNAVQTLQFKAYNLPKATLLLSLQGTLSQNT